MSRVKQQNTLSSVLDPRVKAVDAVAGLLPAKDPGSGARGGLGLGELGRRTLSLVERLEGAPYAARLAELSAKRWPSGRLVELKRLGQAAVALDASDPTAESGARASAVGEAKALRDGLLQTVRSNFAYSHPIHAELKGAGRIAPGWIARDLERLRTSLSDCQSAWAGKVGAAEAASLERIEGLVDALRAQPSDDWSVTRRKVRAVLVRRFREARLFGLAVVADGVEAPALPTMGSRRKKKDDAEAAKAKAEKAKAKAEKAEKAKAEKAAKAKAKAQKAEASTSATSAASASEAEPSTAPASAPVASSPSTAPVPPPAAVGNDG